MFDQEGDAMSVYSQSSRMPSLVMPEGMSMQDYYKALQSQAAELNAASAQRVGGLARPRRNSGSSVMSDTERLYGWSGSRGGISNNEQGPKYVIDSQGHLVLAQAQQKEAAKISTTAASPLQAVSSPAAVLGANNANPSGANPSSAAVAGRPALKSARSEGPPAKPMYRPAFAPSAVLPPSSEDEIDEDDRVIQHDLPTTRPLRSRPSLKQKLGSFVARVGSVRRGGGSATSPAADAGMAPVTSPGGKTEELAPAKDYLAVKRATSSAAAYGRRNNKPEFNRKSSGLAKVPTREEDESEELSKDPSLAEGDGSVAPIVTLTEVNDENKAPDAASTSTPMASKKSSESDDDKYLSSDGGAYKGGMVSLARKLSRRATTGGARHRARSVPRNLRDEREKQLDALDSKEDAKKMLEELAKLSEIPLYPPPPSAHVKNAKPLSSFPPRMPLKGTAESTTALGNATRYKRRVRDTSGGGVDRSNTTGGTGHRPSNSYGRGRSGSTPSTYSSFSATSEKGLLMNGGPLSNGKMPSTIKESSVDEDVPPVPPLPVLAKNDPSPPKLQQEHVPEGDGATTNWTVFKKESSTSLNKH